MTDVLRQFQAYGLCPRKDLVIGNLTRCEVEGDTGTKKSGWYVLHEVWLNNGDRVLVGRFGNWKMSTPPEGIPVEFEKRGQFNADDAVRIQQAQQEAAERASKEKAERQREAAERATKIWDGLPEGGASEYLVRKKVSNHGVRFTNGRIVVPVRTIKGELVGLQFIDGDGAKRFLTGTAKQGAFHLIGEVRDVPDQVLAVGEGYATCATVHETMQWPVAVAFDAGNLKPVAAALRSKYRKAQIIILADNDAATEGNPGVIKATEAAAAVSGKVLVPDFSGVAA